jgi:hypothetical protein
MNIIRRVLFYCNPRHATGCFVYRAGTFTLYYFLYTLYIYISYYYMIYTYVYIQRERIDLALLRAPVITDFWPPFRLFAGLGKCQNNAQKQWSSSPKPDNLTVSRLTLPLIDYYLFWSNSITTTNNNNHHIISAAQSRKQPLEQRTDKQPKKKMMRIWPLSIELVVRS